ncbi:uncharacterized protein LOC8273730 [Ricinus communis]|uniref:uncharacterized protein LOC8273730 n=1 Tax=Ricinus communis TaxID=3988 RepID=UPI00201ACBDC|nr:uncharacterized protein LOC8273730 [Ricinus communis]
MDLERCSVSSSSSSFSSSSASSSAEVEVDRMVRIEMEAAEALADLAHLAMKESGSGDSSTAGGGRWGSKGKRGKKRVKSESPPLDPFTKPVLDSLTNCLDPAPDPAPVDQQHDEPLCSDTVIKAAKVEQDADIPKPSPVSVKNHPSYGGGRSRQNLTEAEKEERRLRRILANRESARQTIRRRQALCEELTRKAADLAWENENLKREKESVLKEFQSLESRNKYLKAQMAKLIKTEVEDSPADLKSAHVDNSLAPATNCSLLLYNQHPFSSLCWPSIIQSSNSVQSHLGPQSTIMIPSSISMPPNGKLDSSQQPQENPMITNGPRIPLYIVSCPWFFPVPEHANGLHPLPSFGLQHKQDGTSVNNQCSRTSSAKATALMQNQFSSASEKVNSEDGNPAINDLNETPVGVPPEGGGHSAAPNHKETVVAPVMLSSVTPTVAVKNETGTRSESVPHTDGICTTSKQLISALPGKNRDPFKFLSKNLVDAAAAAVARRRRKELTKLKNLHGRQCRMNC